MSIIDNNKEYNNKVFQNSNLIDDKSSVNNSQIEMTKKASKIDKKVNNVYNNKVINPSHYMTFQKKEGNNKITQKKNIIYNSHNKNNKNISIYSKRIDDKDDIDYSEDDDFNNMIRESMNAMNTKKTDINNNLISSINSINNGKKEDRNKEIKKQYFDMNNKSINVDNENSHKKRKKKFENDLIIERKCFFFNIQKKNKIQIKNDGANNIKLLLIFNHIDSIQYNPPKIKITNVKPKKNSILRKQLDIDFKKNKFHNNVNNHNGMIKLDLKNPETNNQFINNNIANYNMLKEMKFFERLKEISDKRYSEFKTEFQKDYNFIDIDKFENNFICQNDMNINSPLTLIFHFCFNPEVKQPDTNKNFFEEICEKRGDQNYSMEYKKEEIKDIPKYFNEMNYINNLFNNFNQKDLNRFLEQISSWKKVFSFIQNFKYTIKHFIRIRLMTLRDIATIYFVSPLDLIIDYHSYGSDFPMADVFVAITQYRFHCDISFNKIKGKFNFKNSCTVYNTIKFVKKTLLEKYVIDESNSINKEEIQVNIWPNLEKVLRREDKENQSKSNIIFENYLKKNLNKYSKEMPDKIIYKEFYENNNENKENNKICLNFDFNYYYNYDKISNNNNDNNKEYKLYNNNINIINKIKFKEKDESKEDSLKDNYYQKNDTQIRELKSNNFEKDNIHKNEEKDEKKPKKKRWRKRRILKYGVCIIFGLYVVKTLISLGKGYISKEKKLNIFLIAIIGIILATNHLKRKIKFFK